MKIRNGTMCCGFDLQSVWERDGDGHVPPSCEVDFKVLLYLSILMRPDMRKRICLLERLLSSQAVVLKSKAVSASCLFPQSY